jgi:hypothetical protein
MISLHRAMAQSGSAAKRVGRRPPLPARILSRGSPLTPRHKIVYCIQFDVLPGVRHDPSTHEPLHLRRTPGKRIHYAFRRRAGPLTRKSSRHYGLRKRRYGTPARRSTPR